MCPFCKTKGRIDEEFSSDEGDYGTYTYEFTCPNCLAAWDVREPWSKSYEPMEIEIVEQPDKNNIEHYTKKDEEK